MSANSRNKEPLSTVDAAWLRMDTPTNMALIAGVMMFEHPLDFQRLKAIMEYRLAPTSRFHQRVVYHGRNSNRAYWEDDPFFDVDAHLQKLALPSPSDDGALQELVGSMMSSPLDQNKPLWHMAYVENYNGGSALIVRLHHCIADGLSLVRLLLSITDDTPDAPWPQPPEAEVDGSKSTRLGRALLAPLRVTARGLHVSRRVLEGSLEVLDHPEVVSRTANLGVKAGLALGKLLLIPPDRKTILRGECGVMKRATWSQPIPLEQVKAIGRRHDATVNDVLIAAVTGGIRRYMEKHEQPVDALDIRAVVPYSLRPDEDLNSLGNKFGLVFLSLPVGVRNIVNRLQVVKFRMDQIKSSPEAAVAFGILETIGMTTRQAESIIVKIFAIKATAVMTNVPGPRGPIYVAGELLKGMMFWVPQPGDLALGVSIISYNGEVVVGVAGDQKVIPHPEEIVDGFLEEFNYLAELTG